MCNSKLLVAIATEKGYLIEDVASICGMDFAEFNAKMQNEKEFYATEIMMIRKLLHLTDEELNAVFFAEA